jgi:hypothetical protein
VGFEVGPRCRLAAVDRGDAASIAGWFELGHGPLGQVVWGPCLQGNLPVPGAATLARPRRLRPVANASHATTARKSSAPGQLAGCAVSYRGVYFAAVDPGDAASIAGWFELGHRSGSAAGCSTDSRAAERSACETTPSL